MNEAAGAAFREYGADDFGDFRYVFCRFGSGKLVVGSTRRDDHPITPNLRLALRTEHAWRSGRSDGLETVETGSAEMPVFLANKQNHC